MTDDELKELVASLAVDSKNLHAAQKLTNDQMKRTDEKLERLGNIYFDDVVKNMERIFCIVHRPIDKIIISEGF